jgi:hypothetical protein
LLRGPGADRSGEAVMGAHFSGSPDAPQAMPTRRWA